MKGFELKERAAERRRVTWHLQTKEKQKNKQKIKEIKQTKNKISTQINVKQNKIK